MVTLTYEVIHGSARYGRLLRRGPCRVLLASHASGHHPIRGTADRTQTRRGAFPRKRARKVPLVDWSNGPRAWLLPQARRGSASLSPRAGVNRMRNRAICAAHAPLTPWLIPRSESAIDRELGGLAFRPRSATAAGPHRHRLAPDRASHSGSAACSTESRYESQADGDAAAAITPRAGTADELPVPGQSNH